jgi:hypothetical protein
MKKIRGILLGILALVLVCLVLALLGYLVYSVQRRQAMGTRPLVLIHTPFNRQQIPLGESTQVHASARAESGVTRVELWVDGEFVAAQESLEGAPTSPMVLSAGWEPDIMGPHVLVVRAISASGVDGQAAIAVEVIEAVAGEGPSPHGYIVQEGETLGTIAEETGASEEELEALNPDIGPEGPQPGDLVLHPPEEEDEAGAEEGEEEPAGEEAPLPEPEVEPPPADEPPPDPHAPPPGSWGDMRPAEYFGIDPGLIIPADAASSEPSGLRVEALALETDRAYESVHCYVGVGESDPRWYPDEDLDQSTDESFTLLDDGTWNIAAYLAGGNAPVVTWPGDEPLLIDVTCVGMNEGGSNAVELGHVLITARPEAWDGLTRRAVGASEEGSFTLDYRVSRMEGSGGGHPIFLDPTMTPPTNLRMGFWTLHWDYEPEEDEEPIHGFRVYLNGTLQWVEPPDARQSTLPYEWLSPPCGTTYNFAVTAFRYGYPDGPESRFSNVVPVDGPEHGSEDCNRTLIVRLETLSTEYLERDMGPMHGTFYVNDQVVEFDGRCHGSGICGEVGLYADFEYDISGLLDHLAFGAPARFVVDVPPGEQLVLGYDINAEGEGRACAGETWYEGEDLDRARSGGIVSERPSGYSSRCQVTFTVNPAFGSPTGEPGGLPPLPMLAVENLTVIEETGQLQIHVRNVGAGTWPAKDLDVAVTWPDGSGIGGYMWPGEGLVLRPGRKTILQHPDLVPGPHPPLGACVLLDPGNAVPEEDDYSLAWTRGRYCRPLPDLVITDSVYDDVNERLWVTVENIGEGSVEHRNLNLQINLADGRYFSAPAEWWADVSIEPSGVIVMEWPHIGPEQRALMMDGYTAVIDPYNDIAEESGFNNEFAVRPATRLWLSWTWIDVPYHFRDLVEYSFDAYLVSGGSRRHVADWHIGQDIDWGSCFRPYHCVRHYDNNEYDSYWFDVAGDEELVIEIRVSHPGTLHWARTLSHVYQPEQDWGAGPVGPRRTCGYFGGTSQPHSYTWVFDYSEGYAWDTTFHICREDAE